MKESDFESGRKFMRQYYGVVDFAIADYVNAIVQNSELSGRSREVAGDINPWYRGQLYTLLEKL